MYNMEQVVLDRQSFKALSSETRVSLLKRLSKGRRTASQLAGEFLLSVQSVSEHLGKLEAAGLIQRREEGRKWVYFELTAKGLGVLGDRPNVLLLLALSLLLISTGIFLGLSKSGDGVFSGQSAVSPMQSDSGAGEQAVKSVAVPQQQTTQSTAGGTASPQASSSQLPGFGAIEIILMLAGLGLLGYAVKKKLE